MVHNKIFISNPIEISSEELEKNLKLLQNLEYDGKYSNANIVKIMKKAVPTYKDSKEVNEKKEN